MDCVALRNAVEGTDYSKRGLCMANLNLYTLATLLNPKTMSIVPLSEQVSGRDSPLETRYNRPPFACAGACWSYPC